QVRQTDKDEMKLTVIWAIGAYPVDSEDCEMEIVCGKVVPGNYNNKLRLKMMVASSTHLTIKRDPGSNRYLLKTSLIGVIQDAPKE
ncbi:27601_t:CDS:2, partial [Racocetra persica]